MWFFDLVRYELALSKGVESEVMIGISVEA